MPAKRCLSSAMGIDELKYSVLARKTEKISREGGIETKCNIKSLGAGKTHDTTAKIDL